MEAMPVIQQLRTRARIWGKRDFILGRRVEQNPFDCGSEHTSWKQGWYEERAAWLRTVGGHEL